jgi:hypothetical protein
LPLLCHVFPKRLRSPDSNNNPLPIYQLAVVQLIVYCMSSHRLREELIRLINALLCYCDSAKLGVGRSYSHSRKTTYLRKNRTEQNIPSVISRYRVAGLALLAPSHHRPPAHDSFEKSPFNGPAVAGRRPPENLVPVCKSRERRVTVAGLGRCRCLNTVPPCLLAAICIEIIRLHHMNKPILDPTNEFKSISH